jgi:hypothetical protein
LQYAIEKRLKEVAPTPTSFVIIDIEKNDTKVALSLRMEKDEDVL